MSSDLASMAMWQSKSNNQFHTVFSDTWETELTKQQV